MNKYYPADFDSVKIPGRKQPKNKQIKVRMMPPMSIRCNSCGYYIYKATKFNSRKEDVIDETYYGIQIFRFYFRCTKCSSEIIMKTDLQNSDYVVEYGAMRNLDLWRGDDEQVENKKRKRDAEEMEVPMKCLENRTLDSKREMDIFAALDELKSMKSRHAIVSVDAMLDQLLQEQEEKEKEKKLEEEDEALIFQRSRVVRRIQDKCFSDDYEDSTLFPTDDGEISSNNSKRRTNCNPADCPTKTSINEDPMGPGASISCKFIFKSSSIRVSVIKKPPTKEEESRQGKKYNATNIASNGLQLLYQHYESEEEY